MRRHIVIANHMKLARRSGQCRADLAQTWFEPLAAEAAFGSPSQRRECARTLPPFDNSSPWIETRCRDPLGMQVTVLGKLPRTTRTSPRRMRPRVPVDAHIQVRVREHLE